MEPAWTLCPKFGTFIPTERATDEDRRFHDMTPGELLRALEAADERAAEIQGRGR